MSDALLRVERDQGVALLTLNRPEKRNALSRALRDEFVRCLGEIAKDDALKVALLTGAGPVFCAGFDRKELEGGDMAEVFADADAYHHTVHTFSKPLIAAVQGPALGGGCDLAAMCDFRIASAAAVFGQPQVRFGAPAAYDLMRSVLGTGVSREMCLTGRSYDAQEALAIGLVNLVVEPSELPEVSQTMAQGIASLPDGAPQAAKQMFLASQPRIFGG